MLTRLWIACKAFCKAFSSPKEAALFLANENQPPKNKEEYGSHLRLLALMQHSSRLIDFFKEEIDTYNDGQIGAAVREVHKNCRQVLEELVTIRPVLEQKEGSSITIETGYDPTAIRLIGKVSGKAPYSGTVVHPGWRAHKLSLPKQSGKQQTDILAPAEIEVR